MKKYEFNLDLTPDEYQQYYAGIASAIQVRSLCGKSIRFPAEKMRDFVLSDGIHGRFAIELDDNNKFIRLRRVN